MKWDAVATIVIIVLAFLSIPTYSYVVNKWNMEWASEACNELPHRLLSDHKIKLESVSSRFQIKDDVESAECTMRNKSGVGFRYVVVRDNMKYYRVTDDID